MRKHKAALALLACAGVASCAKPDTSEKQTAAVTTVTAGPASATPSPSHAAVSDGPFGVDVQASFAKLPLGELMDADRNMYLLKVPAPSSSFDSYFAIAYPNVGLCEIRSVSHDFDGDDLGSKLRTEFSRLASALDTKYGPGIIENHCDGGEVSCQEQFWSMSLGEGDRTFASSWEPKPSVTHGIHEVKLWAAAKNITPYLRLDYEINDKSKCEAASKKKGAEHL